MEAFKQIPRSSEKRIALHIKPAAERALRNGHPWLFDQSIVRQNRDGRSGDLAVIYDWKNRFLAIGLYDPHSPLRVRVLQHKTQAKIDQAWYRAKFQTAAKLRVSLPESGTTGYRLIHGENDGLPGLVVDCYSSSYVFRLDTAAWVPHLPEVLAALQTIESVHHIVLRLSRNTMSRAEDLFGLYDGQLLEGPDLDGPVLFQENTLWFEADLIRGQKTGFFLDQRDNRARVKALVSQRRGLNRVLNIFAYTGGFSLYAASGGAKRITSLDASEQALASAERNFLLNQSQVNVNKATHDTICADAFEALIKLGGTGRQFDLIVIDPPSFAKRQNEVGNALRAYRRLVKLGLIVLRPGGILVTASCSSRVSEGEFFKEVMSAGTASGRPLQEISRTGHPVDHPVSFPEGAYLKCLFSIAN